MNNLLTIRNLKTYFFTIRGVVKALEGIDLDLKHQETLGLVGETGCGKSVTVRSILRLIPPPGQIVEGQIIFDGVDLLRLSEREIRNIRGTKISMVMQEPGMSLNPTLRTGYQITEALMAHGGLSHKEASARTIEMLREVKIPDPQKVSRQYPHELSGGMAQRVMIAMMLATQPKLLIADEPTSALDVTTQAQILALLKELIQEFKSSVLLITHDLGVVSETCDRVAVMYAGSVVEYGSIRDVLKNPLHPYTLGLLKTIPDFASRHEDLYSIEGDVPDLISPPLGCRFHPRCPHAMDVCKKASPPEKTYNDHRVACFLFSENSSPDFTKGLK